MADKKSGKNIIGKGKPGPGRPKGMPNKTTALIKDAIIQAAQNAGGDEGMIGYLTEQAEKNPGPFLSLLGKVIPTQLANADGETLAISVTIGGDDKDG